MTSTSSDPTVASEGVPELSNTSVGWLQKLDDWSERFGDAVNPILVKETRQALKSKQFVITFSALLLAALAWTIAGSLSMMPLIYTSPSAPRMLIGYYIVLAVPLLLVVPLAAYRSLETEIDDGTLELLSITSLSPWQIVIGKLASASLQTVLYFVALLPCVAYAYTLRGVDLPTTLLIIVILVASAMLLTIVALFFAPIARGRSGRMVTLLVVIGIFVAAEWTIGYIVIDLIDRGIQFPADQMAFLVVGGILLATCIGHLLLTATAAQLTPESENRSTPLRLSLLMLTAVSIGLAAYGIQSDDREISTISFVFPAMGLGLLWLVAGSMMVSESSAMTPRIQRELPSSFLGRCTLTWLTPGPSTGLVLTTLVGLAIGGCIIVGFEVLVEIQGGRGIARARTSVLQSVLLCVGYAVSFLICVKWIVAVVRIKSNPRADIGIAAMIVVLVATSLIPFAIGLQINDFREYPYSTLQITNWAWTLSEVGNGRLAGQEYWVAGIAAGLFAICLASMSDTVMPRRIAKPKRVIEEEQAKEKQ